MLELIDTYWLYFLVGQYPDGPLGGLVLTILLSGAALVLAMPLGLMLGIARVSHRRAISLPVGAFVQLVRAVPLLL
ncbi:MAG: amino acid ABC transporter permease, partial [Oxalobacteraceae bacterium]